MPSDAVQKLAQARELRAARSLLDIQNGRIQSFSHQTAQRKFRQEGGLYVIGNTSRAVNAHPGWPNESLRFFKRRNFFRNYSHGGAGVNNEVKRFFDTINENLRT